VAAVAASLAPQWRARVLAFGDATLACYGQILFRGSRTLGALLMAATFFEPRVGFAGLAGAVLANLLAHFARLSPEVIQDGRYGYGPLLVGVGVAASYEGGPAALLLIIVGALALVPVTAAAQSALGASFGLPALTVPFLAVFYLVVGSAQVLALTPGGLLVPHEGPPLGFVQAYLHSLGALFFLPEVKVGLMVLLALAVYSRIGLLLSLMGFGLAWALWPDVHAAAGLTPVIVGYNFILTAIALGGVWFVPSPSAFLLGALGACVSGLITLGSLPYLARGGLPMLVLPFNATVLLFLYAMRQRMRDERPKAVDFLLGSPEENLRYFRTREARFGAHYAVRISAPVMGRWICTQGTDGAITHLGAWRHAFDLEVQGRDGRTHRGDGLLLPDYHCYGLPVLAPAEATVIKVVDGVPDSPVGKPNLEENWGNVVVLQLGLGLYALICHLSPGSITVREGQSVRRGEVLAKCGSSGRADVPHVHMHLQATAQVGAPTITTELHDLVVARHQPGPEPWGPPHLVPTAVPGLGDQLRNLEPDPAVRRLFEWRYHQALTFSVDGVAEKLVPDLDLYGNLSLFSPATGARLYYDLGLGVFTVYDVLGARSSALHLIRAALARVPLEASDELTWEDEVAFAPHPGIAWALDFVSPFTSAGTLRMRYGRRRDGARLVVEGRSEASRRGVPLLATEAELQTGVGITRVQVALRGRLSTALRVHPHPEEVPS